MVNDPPCFELIKSLNKTDKIFFKRHLTNHTNKSKPTIYLQLFDELDKMHHYDAKRLHKKFKGEKFLDHLSVSFNYLYNMLLSNLVQLDIEKDDHLKATAMLGQIKVLLKKRLFKQCETQIKRAKKFMQERELFTHLYLLGAHEFNLVSITLQKNEIDDILNINQNRKNLLQILGYHMQIIDLGGRIFQLMRIKELKPNYQIDKTLIAAIEIELKQMEKLITQAGYFFHTRFLLAKQRYLFITNNLFAAFNQLEKILLVHKKAPIKIAIGSEAYLVILKNYLSTSIDLWQAQAIKKWISDLELIAKKEPKLTTQCTLQTYRFQFWQFLIAADFKKLKPFIKDYELFLKEPDKINLDYYRFFLYTNLAIYYFLLEEMKTCVTWINKIFTLKNVDDSIRQNNLHIRYIELMAHFNLQNYELLDSIGLSIIRQQQNIASSKVEFAVEKKWLQGMRKARQFNLPLDKKDFVRQLPKININTLPVNLGYTLIICWVNSVLLESKMEKAWKQVAFKVHYSVESQLQTY